MANATSMMRIAGVRGFDSSARADAHTAPRSARNFTVNRRWNKANCFRGLIEVENKKFRADENYEHQPHEFTARLASSPITFASALIN
jgi:hypothetical protein